LGFEPGTMVVPKRSYSLTLTEAHYDQALIGLGVEVLLTLSYKRGQKFC
jgi:hypothetical protein